MIFGILGSRTDPLANWTEGKDVFHGGWISIVAVFMIAGFSFQGTELVGVAAGEAKDPRREVPKAVRTVFWRIMLFYIGAIFIIGTLVPFTDRACWPAEKPMSLPLHSPWSSSVPALPLRPLP
jgi:lysine-specific permease